MTIVTLAAVIREVFDLDSTIDSERIMEVLRARLSPRDLRRVPPRFDSPGGHFEADRLLRDILRLAGPPEIVDISEKAAAVFAQLDDLEPNDTGTATRLMMPLRQGPWTEGLTWRLQGYLKTRDWRIKCKCGARATVLWQKAPTSKLKLGGRMKLTHKNPSDPRKNKVHGWKSMPILEFVRNESEKGLESV